MNEYEFTLKFKLLDKMVATDSFLEKLGEEGCDDALIGIGQQGKMALNFTRESNNALMAVCSAIEDVKRAVPEAVLIEATPDLVGISDIAEVLGVSRQNVRKLVASDKAVFPIPVHEGRSAIWHLFNVLSWSKKENRYEFDHSLLDVTKATMTLNIAKESLQVTINSDLKSVLAM